MLKQFPGLVISLVIITLLLLVIAAYGLITNGQRIQTNENNQTQQANNAEQSSSAQTKSIDVYMYDEVKAQNAGVNSFENGNSVSSVKRVVLEKSAIQNSIEEIIKGPTLEEQKLGLKPTFGKNLTISLEGVSNCNGADFIITVFPNTKLATLKFCKDALPAGDLSSVIFYQQLYRTLAQFSDKITDVQVLNKDGQCYDDMRGDAIPSQCIYPLTTF